MRKGQRYITCVIDHETGRLVWAKEGRNKDTLRAFFSDLGDERSRLLTHVSCDGAEWIHTVVAERAPKAKICLDPFHVMQWASKATDDVRRDLWRQLRGTPEAECIKGARWALLRAPHHQSAKQKNMLEEIEKMNTPLYRAYMIKEQLRLAVARKGTLGKRLLLGWMHLARESGLRPFVKLAATIEHYHQAITNTMEQKLSNARSEATNTHLRVLTRRPYGFHSAHALISMAMLTRGGLCPTLPGRAA